MMWGATEAKAKFSELLDRAQASGPQYVHRRKQRFILLTEEEYDARPTGLPGDTTRGTSKKYANLADFFRNSPLAKYGIEVKRIRSKPRPVDL